MAAGSPRIIISTDTDTDDKNQGFDGGHSVTVGASDSSDRWKDKMDQKYSLPRLSQNREASRKSWFRKKAYVQKLESSRLKLTQHEQELQQARQQGIFKSSSGDQAHSMSGNGTMACDVEYALWLEEQNRQMNKLRPAFNSHACDTEPRTITDDIMAHSSVPPPSSISIDLGVNSSSDKTSKIVSELLQLPPQETLKVVQGFFNKSIDSMVKTLVEGQTTSSIKAELEANTAKMYTVEGMVLDLEKERDDTCAARDKLQKKVEEAAEEMAKVRAELEQTKDQHNQVTGQLKTAKDDAVKEWKNSDEYANIFKDYYWGDLTKRIVPLIDAWFQLEKAEKGWPEGVKLDLSWIALDGIKDAAADITVRRKAAREAERQAHVARVEQSESL